MNRKYIESFLGEKVEIVLFDGKIVKGLFLKGNTNKIYEDPNRNFSNKIYYCINPQSCVFKSSHIKKIKKVDD